MTEIEQCLQTIKYHFQSGQELSAPLAYALYGVTDFAKVIALLKQEGYEFDSYGNKFGYKVFTLKSINTPFNQIECIINYLQKHKTINKIEAAEHCGCLRLSSAIKVIRKHYNVITRYNRDNKFLCYELVSGGVR